MRNEELGMVAASPRIALILITSISKIPFYIARRIHKMDRDMFHVKRISIHFHIKNKKGVLGRFINCAPLPSFRIPNFSFLIDF